MVPQLESDLQDTVDWGRKWLVDFNAGKTQLVSFEQSNKTDVINLNMNGSYGGTSFKMVGLTFSSKLDWGFYIISITKTACKSQIGVLICSMKFLSPEIALYLYKSIRPWMEYCCHVWAGAASCYLELLDKLQKHIQDCWSFTCCLS